MQSFLNMHHDGRKSRPTLSVNGRFDAKTSRSMQNFLNRNQENSNLKVKDKFDQKCVSTMQNYLKSHWKMSKSWKSQNTLRNDGIWDFTTTMSLQTFLNNQK